MKVTTIKNIDIIRSKQRDDYSNSIQKNLKQKVNLVFFFNYYEPGVCKVSEKIVGAQLLVIFLLSDERQPSCGNVDNINEVTNPETLQVQLKFLFYRLRQICVLVKQSLTGNMKLQNFSWMELALPM